MPEPEVEVTSPAVEQEEIDYAALPKVSLNSKSIAGVFIHTLRAVVLQDIRAVQQQNGLLHDDYTRYRYEWNSEAFVWAKRFVPANTVHVGSAVCARGSRSS